MPAYTEQAIATKLHCALHNLDEWLQQPSSTDLTPVEHARHELREVLGAYPCPVQLSSVAVYVAEHRPRSRR